MTILVFHDFFSNLLNDYYFLTPLTTTNEPLSYPS